ncbi:CRISPR-associated RAMP protein Csx7 [Sulfolobus tengchongensis]|uniref:CRISPR-associated RAMP protein Csx7 n=1 Tax=Sulfolobus tengchongensis TaxID=207809 RepID=A0AAX4L370_9CREN
MSCQDLDAINTIVKIEGKLVNETPLRIGSGKTQEFEEATDNPIMKYRGKPLIPGSTLKGALRSLAESYINTLTDPKYKVLCDINENEEKCSSCGKDSYCIPCILFGFKDLSSRVYILDSIVEDNSFAISQRTMVAISRVFGGQLPKHLYTLDYVEPNAKFSFTMIIYNLDIVNGEKEEWKSKAVETMKFLLKTLTSQGIFIGARKSVGYGLVKLIEGKVYLYKAPNLLNAQIYDLEKVI